MLSIRNRRINSEFQHSKVIHFTELTLWWYSTFLLFTTRHGEILTLFADRLENLSNFNDSLLKTCIRRVSQTWDPLTLTPRLILRLYLHPSFRWNIAHDFTDEIVCNAAYLGLFWDLFPIGMIEGPGPPGLTIPMLMWGWCSVTEHWASVQGSSSHHNHH